MEYIKWFLIFLLFVSNISIAEVYKWVDKNGKVHYSDKKPLSSGNKDIENVQVKAVNAIKPEEKDRHSMRKFLVKREYERKTKQVRLENQRRREMIAARNKERSENAKKEKELYDAELQRRRVLNRIAREQGREAIY